jgi:O-antigen ligase
MKTPARIALIFFGVIGCCFLFLYAERRPFLFANVRYLGGILVLEIVIACLWRYEKVFFPITMGCFLLAATSLPFAAESYTIRWLFLAIGALFGLSLWMKTAREKHFGVFHLVALFCVFSAIASASSSTSPRIGLLKAVSLFLLFLYAATGGRLAAIGRERNFVRGLVRACELMAFVVAACYFAGYNFFGNPNNLGAFIGVIVTPVLLWAALTTEDRSERQRRYLALALCAVLLYATVCRAAIVADVVVTVALTIGLRHPRLLIRAVFMGALFLEIMAVANPSRMGEFMDSLTGKFIFKTEGRTGNGGLFGSRQSPWDDTIAAVKQHPWFGTGFGTSDLGSEQPGIAESSIYTVEGTNREHGSSYLAMAEYMGLLGIVPFIFILVLVLRAAAQVFAWMRRTTSPHHCAVPLALIAVAGLVHAGFEDWLFATGSYLCVFFWISAFLLVDLAATARDGLRTAAIPAIGAFAPMPAFRRTTTLP